ncbi:MAG: hypothetical protein JF603_10435 [Acidobacteria bacterium]|nr:hypothetical protein [Acidobacteriota bacterium]
MARSATPDVNDRHEWLSFDDPEEQRTWVFDITFLLSRWTCIFGQGCQGVLTEPAPEMVEGCCSYGAHFVDDDDMRRTQKAVDTLTPDDWQWAKVAAKKGVMEQHDDGTWTTRLHKDACIMLNRPDFPGGPGCALHRAAMSRGLRHMDLKPEVCWQLPLRRIDAVDELGHVTSTVREWKRRDWGDGGQEFAWWCTDSPDAFVGDTTVLSSMRDEIIAMTNQTVFDMLLGALAERSAPPMPHPAVQVAAPKRRA